MIQERTALLNSRTLKDHHPAISMRIANNILSSCVTALIIAASQPLVILAAGSAGAECYQDSECDSGSCVNMLCAAPSPPPAGSTGAECYADGECDSNSCVDMVCAAPPPAGSTGAWCYADSECDSNSCVEMVCAAPPPPAGSTGAWCYVDNECDSNSCVDMACAALQGSPAGSSGGKLQYYDQFCINGAFFNYVLFEHIEYFNRYLYSDILTFSLFAKTLISRDSINLFSVTMASAT